MDDATALETLTPDFGQVFLMRAVTEREPGLYYTQQFVYNKLRNARSKVHFYKHYKTGKSTAHIAIYSCHPMTGEWQIEHIFEQGEDLTKPLPWQEGYKE